MFYIIVILTSNIPAMKIAKKRKMSNFDSEKEIFLDSDSDEYEEKDGESEVEDLNSTGDDSRGSSSASRWLTPGEA